ncbi:family 20 glycosylhydrolase [Daejeonella oryzae]|uniref:family 20 glycosylhydrolase n=1 Tax=Daejeonella oryzae TaxID=1122943 RepID=UPI00042350A7|nr:family 20 glycosylhydrolase [Daejeonella oryzae]
MRRFFLFTFVILISAQFSKSQTNDPNLGIIPVPKSIKPQTGQFTFSNQYAIQYETESDQKIAQLFHDYLKEVHFLDLVVAKNFIKAPEGIIRFSSAEYKGSNPEGYELSVNPTQINVSGKGAGLFYGLKTLMQLIPKHTQAAPQINSVLIEDEPRYKYRGMHLDVVRHMFPVSFIKKYIDLLAQYKLNSFHWHLTDDQGWRIEIKKYPKLTQVGAYRDQTIIGHFHDRFPQRFDQTQYGGFYTQEEIKDVVKYASEKFITVIPEIEMPGHALAALSAYPELGCGPNPGPYKVAEKWGIFEDIFCAGKESTFSFLEDVLSEVIPLFPGTYIHIGGDEAPKTQWNKCRFCQKRISDNKLKDEHQLQSYFVQRIEKFVNSNGRQIIGWDEILEGGLAPNATVMSWRGTVGGIAAAKLNHNVIMTPDSHVYFDHYQGNAVQEPLTIHGLSTLEKVYNYNPTPENLDPKFQKYILGVQANVWTEYMATSAKVEYMVLPRLLSLSEIAWSAPERKNFKNFNEQRVAKHLGAIDQTDFLYRIPTAIGAMDTTLIGSQFTLDYKLPVEGGKIFYTIDGYNPRATDLLYDKPLNIKVPEDDQRIVKTIVITPSGKTSAVTTTILSNLLPLASASVTTKGAGLNYYYVPGVFNSTDKIDISKSAERGIAPVLNLTKFRNKSRTYGAVFNGYIFIESDGIYKFSTFSDDGSVVMIDGQLVVNNDGKHTGFETSGAVNLLKGYHQIQVSYFQQGGQSNLRVFITEPGKEKAEIPARLLFN